MNKEDNELRESEQERCILLVDYSYVAENMVFERHCILIGSGRFRESFF